MGDLRVLDEDQPRLALIETDVNANRATMSLPPLPGGDIIAGCVQVGLNALTNGRDVPNSRANIPTLSIVGLPYTDDIVVFSAELDARVAAIAAVLSVTAEDLSSLALHAGCLTMTSETENKGYVPSFS
jgi:hypothetical protein